MYSKHDFYNFYDILFFHNFQEKFSKKNDNMSQLRSQVDEVKGVMTQNIEKVLERGERLDDLMDKTTELEASVSKWTERWP